MSKAEKLKQVKCKCEAKRLLATVGPKDIWPDRETTVVQQDRKIYVQCPSCHREEFFLEVSDFTKTFHRPGRLPN